MTKEEREDQVAALQISSMEAWVAQAANVAALRVEWGKILAGIGPPLNSYALEIQALSQRPTVAEETFWSIDEGRKEGN